MKRSDIEIMAPVGSYESLAAAIGAGADAVYFGVGKLNMRSASAANFTLDDLEKIVATARKADMQNRQNRFTGNIYTDLKFLGDDRLVFRTQFGVDDIFSMDRMFLPNDLAVSVDGPGKGNVATFNTKTWVWDNTAKLHIGDSGRVQGFLNASEKTGADHAAASVVEQDFFTVYIFYKLSDPVFGFFSEYDAGRGIEIKIKHKTPS